MRIVIGLMFLCHGLQKAVGAFGGVNGAAAPFFSLLGIAGWLEVLLGLMVALGIFTSLAVFSPAVRWRRRISSVTCPRGFGQS